MTLPTVTITGPVVLPDGVAIGGAVVFTLSGPDADHIGGVVAPREVRATLADSNFEVSLWPTRRGAKDRHYSVTLYLPGQKPSSLGAFRLDEDQPARALPDLLRGQGVADAIELSLEDWLAAGLTAAGNRYGSVAEALDATADTDWFFVVSGAGLKIELWRNIAGSALPAVIEVNA